MVGGRAGTRGWVGELKPEGRWVSRNQRVGERAGTRGWVGELGPEVGWAS